MTGYSAAYFLGEDSAAAAALKVTATARLEAEAALVMPGSEPARRRRPGSSRWAGWPLTSPR